MAQFSPGEGAPPAQRSPAWTNEQWTESDCPLSSYCTVTTVMKSQDKWCKRANEEGAEDMHTIRHSSTDMPVSYLHGSRDEGPVLLIQCQINSSPNIYQRVLSQESPCSLAKISVTDLAQFILYGPAIVVHLDCNLDKISAWCWPLIFGLVAITKLMRNACVWNIKF